MQSKTNELLITLAQRIIRQSNFIWGGIDLYVTTRVQMEMVVREDEVEC